MRPYDYTDPAWVSYEIINRQIMRESMSGPSPTAAEWLIFVATAVGLIWLFGFIFRRASGIR